MVALRSGEDFYLDLKAQIDKADRILTTIFDEFSKVPPGSEISRAGRIETKEFILSLKHVLDQLTVRVWQTLVYPELSQETAEKKLGVIYYPYAADEQMLQSALGKMIDIKRFSGGNGTPGEVMFAGWLRAAQPIGIPYRPLHTIGRLSRLPHQKLIEQRKTRLFVVEAFGPNGGGASLRFKDNPGRFTLWTYRDKTGSSCGLGAHPINNDPDAELTVFTFDPDTMDFNYVPGAVTSVQEVMECHVEDMEFDALPLFRAALQEVNQLVSSSAFLLG